MNPIPLDLTIQYEVTHTELTDERLHLWVQTALQTASTVYEDADLVPPFNQAAFTLRFCDEKEGQELNKQYRDKDYATNVLTFEYGIDPEGTISSDIIICTSVLEKEALEQGKPFIHHAAHLCVHGVLHALGYDHIEDDDAEDMEALEVDILHSLNIPNPY